MLSQEFQSRLKDVVGVRFVPIQLGRVVNYRWSASESLYFAPGDQTYVELFASLPEVDSRDLEIRYEMLAYEHSLIIGNFKNLKTISLETGTQPLSKISEYQFSKELFTTNPIHRFLGSIIFHGSEWEKVDDLVDAEFFNIRKVDVDF